jgi:hypothetical protein
VVRVESRWIMRTALIVCLEAYFSHKAQGGWMATVAEEWT